MEITLPSHINTSGARLPQAYEAAKAALATCESLDECCEWADKAAALASYARQANDDELEKRSLRIRSRAVRRAGELLKQFDAQGKRTDQLTAGDHLKLSQREAAERAGMSEHQQKQAVRVANIPADKFEAQVEAEKPPTISKLAEQGKTPRVPLVDLRGRDPKDFNDALHFIAIFDDYLKELKASGYDRIVLLLDADERTRLRNCITSIDTIHDQIVTRI